MTSRCSRRCVTTRRLGPNRSAFRSRKRSEKWLARTAIGRSPFRSKRFVRCYRPPVLRPRFTELSTRSGAKFKAPNRQQYNQLQSFYYIDVNNRNVVKVEEIRNPLSGIVL